jgi:hypothetical protein
MSTFLLISAQYGTLLLIRIPGMCNISKYVYFDGTYATVTGKKFKTNEMDWNLISENQN